MTDIELTAWACGEGEAALGEHLQSCAACQGALREVEEVLAEARHVLRGDAAPPPPREWPAFEELAPGRRRGVGAPASWRPWAMAAMVLLAGAVGVWLSRPQPVSAAQLLVKAVAAETASARPRAVRLRGVTEARAKELFRAARYDDQAPLTVRAYAAWHGALERKQDGVETLENGDYLIRTSTSEAGPLREATLALRHDDLHPLRGTWRFDANETIEIQEVPAPLAPGASGAGAGAGGATNFPQVAPPSAPATLTLDQRKLAVFSALHAMGADLGEAIEIDGSVDPPRVTATGLTPLRRQQVQEALARITGVELRFDEATAQALPSSARPARGTPPSASAAGLLREALGARSVAIDGLLDASEAMVARAHALRTLAEHFPAPPSAALTLTPENQAELARLRQAHGAALERELRTLAAQLEPVLPPPPAARDGRSVQELVRAAQRVDQLLTETLAGTGRDTPDQAVELAFALARLRHQVEGVAW